MRIMHYIPFTLMIAAMIWMTIDAANPDNGFITINGNVAKAIGFIWLVFIGGILTHHFWVNAHRCTKE